MLTASEVGAALAVASCHELSQPPAQPRQELLLREPGLGLPSHGCDGSELAAGLRPERPPCGWRALWSARGLQPSADRLRSRNSFGSGEEATSWQRTSRVALGPDSEDEAVEAPSGHDGSAEDSSATSTWNP